MLIILISEYNNEKKKRRGDKDKEKRDDFRKMAQKNADDRHSRTSSNPQPVKGDINALPHPIKMKPHRYLVSEKKDTKIKLCR
jgi:hypothetical protein